MPFTLRKIDLHKPTATWYAEYLQSDKWRAFRARLIELRGLLCEVCGERDHFSLHHKTYARLFSELEEDVILVCKECHKEIHETYDIPFIFYIYLELDDVMEFLSYAYSKKSKKQPTKRN